MVRDHFYSTSPIRERNPWYPVMWVNPAQPPSVSRCAPRSRSLVCCVPDRHSNQERSFLLGAGGDPGTLSFSHPAGHPSFGVSVLFFIVFISTLCLFIRDCGERVRRAAIATVFLFRPPFLPVVDCPARPGAGFFFIPRRCSGSPLRLETRCIRGGRHGGSEIFTENGARAGASGD